MVKIYFKTPIYWNAAFKIIFLHILGFYGFYLAITGQSDLRTVLFFLVTFLLSTFSITIGAHRLFSHKCFETNRLLKVILLTMFNYTAQYSVYDWVLLHRVHHKYSDTEADPYNSKRGIFFCHMGWVLLERTKEYKEKATKIDMSDLHSDQEVMFQHKYYHLLVVLQWSIARFIPYYFWNETFVNTVCTLSLGFIVLLNHTQLINSLNHCWGWKPYDTKIEPTFSRLASYLTNGEGYHNFHHVFPNDYSASELKWTQNYNPSTMIIDGLESIGWVKNKKVANPELIQKRRLRTGDNTVIIQPRWNIALDYFIGFIVCHFSIWITLFLRYVLGHLSN